MKYLKKFENIEYEVGDYVKLKYVPIDTVYYARIENLEENRFVQIIHIKTNTSHSCMFRILKTGIEFSSNPFCIDRKLRKEEIEKYEIEQNINKYNL